MNSIIIGRWGLVLGLIALVGSLHAAPAEAADALEGERIDLVWSGHPVSYAILAEQGTLFIAYYDAERRMTVLSRKEGEAQWTRFLPEGVFLPGRKRMSNVTGWDSHNYLTMALDRDGYLHLSGNMHGDPLIYYRTRKPYDITTLQRIDTMTGQNEDRTTYPRFIRDGEGRMVYRYRNGGSGNGNDFYNLYDPDQRIWTPLLKTPLLDGEGKCSAYGTGPRKGPDGRFHMLWMWRDTPNAGSNHTLSYARSRDLVNWETSTGKRCPLPLTPGKGEVIDPAPPFKGLINMCYSLGFDANHTPVVAYHRYDDEGMSQAYAARISNDGKWMIRQISDWDFRWEFSKNGSQDKDVSVRFAGFNPDCSLNLSYKTKTESGRWRLDAKTLEHLELLPRPPTKKTKLIYPHLNYPGIEMNQRSCSRDGGRWILQWETLRRNQDKPRKEVPPHSELRLYSVPN